jgi:hypothetical protein
MTYDPYADWVPPKADDGEPEISIERWKFDALLRGAFNRSMQQISEMARADDGVGASALPEEAKPPPLAADAEEPEPMPNAAIDPDLMEIIEAKLDELATRMDALERRKAAESALLALEDEIERMYPASNDDDDDDDAMMLKPRRH